MCKFTLVHVCVQRCMQAKRTEDATQPTSYGCGILSTAAVCCKIGNNSYTKVSTTSFWQCLTSNATVINDCRTFLLQMLRFFLVKIPCASGIALDLFSEYIFAFYHPMVSHCDKERWDLQSICPILSHTMESLRNVAWSRIFAEELTFIHKRNFRYFRDDVNLFRQTSLNPMSAMDGSALSVQWTVQHWWDNYATES